MEFPAYVPAAVRIHVERLLPVIETLVDRGRYLELVREYFREQNEKGDYYHRTFSSFVDEHLATLIERRNKVDELISHKECLIRLCLDERMRQSYGLLSTQFNNDESWHKLVWAATTAAIDFWPHRMALANSSVLCRKIGEVSDYLGFLLDEIGGCNINIPAFNTVSVLIKHEDEELMQDLLHLQVRTIIEELANKARVTARQMDKRERDSREEFAWCFSEFEHNSCQQS